jgi:hypothetical protein
MAEEERQRVERASGRARRARLTPAPGTDPSPEAPVSDAPASDADGNAKRRTKPKGGRPDPDDDRITRERPPHW